MKQLNMLYIKKSFIFLDGARAGPGPWNHPGQGFVF
jgi:hypothetical protein